MKLSEADRENIEVLEALGVDESTLLFLLHTYFGHRFNHVADHLAVSPDYALQETIRLSVQGVRVHRAFVLHSNNASGKGGERCSSTQ
jgi:hypothetical protein